MAYLPELLFFTRISPARKSTRDARQTIIVFAMGATCAKRSSYSRVEPDDVYEIDQMFYKATQQGWEEAARRGGSCGFSPGTAMRVLRTWMVAPAAMGVAGTRGAPLRTATLPPPPPLPPPLPPFPAPLLPPLPPPSRAAFSARALSPPPLFIEEKRVVPSRQKYEMDRGPPPERSDARGGSRSSIHRSRERLLLPVTPRDVAVYDTPGRGGCAASMNTAPTRCGRAMQICDVRKTRTTLYSTDGE